MTAPGPPPSKRLHVRTYGCQMNVYDSERMADVLRPLGYALTDRAEDADMVVLNTCHIREKAAEKVYSELGRLKELRAERLAAGHARSTIVVAGCVAQAQGAEIMTRQPAVDLVVGPQAYHQLPELIARTARARGERLAADFAPQAKFDALPVERTVAGVTAFLTVQEGCDKFCSFCVVPYTRGAEWSRPAAAVVAEARSLAAQGVREVTLLGQNVNAYAGAAPGGGAWSLARLIGELARIDGLARIRFTTSHPGDMGEDLVAAFADTPAMMPYLHLPVQSGADRVLRAMNRRHTAAHYLALVDRLRAARPDLALTSDFIVGFPGETDADFAETLRLAGAVGYAGAYTFKYSVRPGTPAAVLPGQVEDAVKAERLAALNAVIDRDRRAFDAAQLGATLPVLWEKPGRQPGQIIGRSPYLQAVWAQAPASLIGTITDVEVVGLSANSLHAAVETGDLYTPEATCASSSDRRDLAS